MCILHGMAEHEGRPVRVSALVRTKDKADTVAATLAGLRAQSEPVEIVVIDSGSTDGTVEIARSYADRVVTMPAEEFSYGRALNLGVQAASGEVVVALSAHCVPPDGGWLRRGLTHFDRPEVIAAGGRLLNADGRLLASPVDIDQASLQRDPTWTLSNHASFLRRSACRQFPFDESLEASEDLEWCHRALRAGGVIAVDPGIHVEGAHRRSAGLRALFRRVRMETRANYTVLDLPPMTLRDALTWWWSRVPAVTGPRWLGRLQPARLAQVSGKLVGSREASRRH
jgi:rhamnosyltransferase